MLSDNTGNTYTNDRHMAYRTFAFISQGADTITKQTEEI